jgi:carotenoid cleavage dioxygenase-like enzyme
MTDTTTSQWLSGNYAPVTEERTATQLTIRGTLPPELNGRYLRNGPNPVVAPDPGTYHWFTGDAMVHGIQLREGRADWYRNRWVRSETVSDALGEPHASGRRHGGMDTANTNVIGLGDRTFAIVEAGACPVELSRELETVAHSDLGGTLPNGFSAHPKVDPATGDLHLIAYHWALPHLQYVVVGADARVRSVEAIEVDDGPMVHDCSITERWMVVYDLPVTFSMDDAAAGARFPYAWRDGRAARVGLVPLGGSGAEVRWFEVEPCYVFHPLNAHDDGDTVVLDVVRHERVFDTHRLGPDESLPQLWRWTLDLVSGAVTEEQLSDVGLEFPRVDERRVGRAHRYGYATSVEQSLGLQVGGQLVRFDARDASTEVVDLGPGRTSGEWVMVPRDDAAAEDDGWLMALVHDAATDTSELLVLSAEDPSAGPVAAVELPTRVPVGFHGNWVPDAP